MATKDNLNKAVYDMFGIGTDTEGANKASAAAAQPQQPISKPVQQAAPVTAAVPQLQPTFHAAAASSAPAAGNGNITYLAPGSYLEGTLKVKGDVEIAGDFKGDMSASGNVTIHANINSNVTAARLDLVACKLVGDIHASSVVVVDENSSVEGKVCAAELICAGKIKGNVEVSENSIYREGSRVDGNITTGSMTMERGAVINGSLSMGAPAPAAAKAEEKRPDGPVVIAVH
jgi:cytoskeletal protein CcmA (bactofilin family)